MTSSDKNETVIYLIRHAEASGNARGRFMGRTDSPLSEKGLEQCRYLAKRFAALQLDRVFSSPLKRALETAIAAGSAHGLTPEVREGLIEIDAGAWEGESLERLRAGEDYRIWREEPCRFVAPGGESMRSVYERTGLALERIARECTGGAAAVVSHGCAVRNIIGRVAGFGLEGLDKVPVPPNTAVCRIIYDGSFRLDGEPEVSHLPEELRTSIWKK